MGRRIFGREFRLEAVKLVRERGVSQAPRAPPPSAALGVAVTMGEVEPPAMAPANHDALDEVLERLGHPGAPALKRGRGRPRKAGGPLTQAERTRRWREARDIVSIEIPAVVAERLRRLCSVRGRTAAELLVTAMDALERAEGDRAA